MCWVGLRGKEKISKNENEENKCEKKCDIAESLFPFVNPKRDIIIIINVLLT